MATEYLTKDGYKKLQGELDNLRNVKRKEIAERLREAAENSLGEFVEDPEFEAAKNEQSFVEGRIKELEMILANATLIEEHKGRKKGGPIEIGALSEESAKCHFFTLQNIESQRFRISRFGFFRSTIL